MVINNNKGLVKNRFNGSSTCPRKEESTFVMNTIPLLVNKESDLDGFCEETRTVFEYNGCYYHKHCGENYNAATWSKTVERENTLREMGYNVESITSCQWHDDPRSQIWYATSEVPCTMDDIIQDVNSDL